LVALLQQLRALLRILDRAHGPRWPGFFFCHSAIRHSRRRDRLGRGRHLIERQLRLAVAELHRVAAGRSGQEVDGQVAAATAVQTADCFEATNIVILLGLVLRDQ
jgi:hypothetical protein